jgi:hypothetical protein
MSPPWGITHWRSKAGFDYPSRSCGGTRHGRCYPKGRAREVRSAREDPCYELALAGQQRLVLRAVEPDRHTPGPVERDWSLNIVLAKLMMSEQSPYSKQGWPRRSAASRRSHGTRHCAPEAQDSTRRPLTGTHSPWNVCGKLNRKPDAGRRRTPIGKSNSVRQNRVDHPVCWRLGGFEHNLGYR